MAVHLMMAGLSHHTAPVAVRERLAFGPEQLRVIVRAARQIPGAVEAAVLSTCNRTEVYTAGRIRDISVLKSFLEEHGGLEVSPHLYAREGSGVVRHLFRVASGADSMVLGEGQVLGQVRDAARLAVEEGSPCPTIRRLFESAVVCGRRVRTETEIGRGAVSVSHTAVELARQIFGNLKGRSILLVGAGETAELTAKALVQHGVSFIVVANRTLERAEMLAETFGGKAVGYDEFPERLGTADIVITSTAAPHTIVSVETARKAADRRRGRPIFFIDLALPRDVEPSVGDLDNVFLYNLDDLQEMVQRSLEGRGSELDAVNAIIEEQAREFELWLGRLEIVPVMSEFQARLEQIRQREWSRSERKLAALTTAQRETVERMTRAMMKRILSEPWSFVRENEDTSDIAAALSSLVDMFHLDPASLDSTSTDESPIEEAAG